MSSRSAFGRDKCNTMPSTSRSQQKAEAIYNVTTDYPHYDLHFAAASGNLGLVEFAVSHGQPVNSVLNGILPLHAACAGGCEIVVRYLIEAGADVNAPRLPRRYSNDKHRSTGPAVGASGSTPLHFAAANGHIGVMSLLLSHGAVPDRADKHGLTPEALAREKGWIECADLLAQWSDSRADDLPPIKSEDKNDGTHANISAVGASEHEKRAQVKRSLDNALHLIKSPLQLHHHNSTGHLRLSPSSTGLNMFQSHPHHPPQLQSSHSHSTVQTLPSAAELTKHTSESAVLTRPPPQPHGDCLPTSSLTRLSSDALEDIATQRKPSLPKIFGTEPVSPFQRHRPSGEKRRPCSAGTDAQRAGILNSDSATNQEDSGKDTSNASFQGQFGTLSTIGGMLAPHKTSSKISLRNLFRRANGSAETGLGSSSEPGSGSPSGTASYSASPVPVQLHVQRSHSTNRGSSHAPSPSMTPPASPISGTFASSASPDLEGGRSTGSAWAPSVRYRNRKASENVTPRIPLVPEDGELRPRNSREDVLSSSLNEALPSILRGRLRSSSSQSSAGSGPKALRFESESGTSEIWDRLPSMHEGPVLSATTEKLPAPAVRGCRSTSSLRRDKVVGENVPAQDTAHVLPSTRVSPRDGSAENLVNKTELSGPTGEDLHLVSAHARSVRRRGASFASSISSSSGASPHDIDSRSACVSSEFPFSLERHPFMPISTTSALMTTLREASADAAAEVARKGRRLTARNDTRLRGESFSSTDTDGSTSASANATLSSDRSANIEATIPSVGICSVPPILREADLPQAIYAASNMEYIEGSPSSSLEDVTTPPTALTRRSPAYTPLDLRGISNLAEAEALVRRKQQEILVSAELPAEGPDSPGIPLSVQLAAYGEILALERRFARGEKQREQWAHRGESEDEGEFGSLPSHSEKESRRSNPSASQIRREISARRRAAAAAEQVTIAESDHLRAVRSANSRSSLAYARRPRHKRPHTAEGNIKSEWNFAPLREVSREYASVRGKSDVTDGYHLPLESSSSELDQMHLAQAHSGLSSFPAPGDREVERHPGIQIVETAATPIDSPDTPERVKCSSSSESTTDYMTASFATARPVRSRTPDPDPIGVVDTGDRVTGGVPLFRVSTTPLQDLQTKSYPNRDTLRLNAPAPRLGSSSHKLARMGFAVDAPLSSRRQHSSTVSNDISRSPPKHYIFEGIKSFVQGLRGKP